MSDDIFSSHRENADLFNLIINLMKKGYFLRKWANLANLNIKSIKQNPRVQIFSAEKETQLMFDRVIRQDDIIIQQPEQSNIEQIQLLQKQTENYLLTQKQQKKPVNLKYGDIVFFKNFVQLNNDSSIEEAVTAKGIIVGDGIASNKIECVPEYGLQIEGQKPVLEKNAKLMFRKCLFQIMNSKKYYYHNLLEKALQMEIEIPEILEELKTKCAQEDEENNRVGERLKNQNVLYGQQIQLFHIYSQTIVRLNTNVLANQTTCRELSLEETPNEYSNFVFLSANNVKKVGELILYSELVTINCVKNDHYFLNVDKSEQQIENFNQGLEVNASQDMAILKLCSFMDQSSLQQKQNNSNKVLQGGDVLVLFNRATNGRLAIRRKQDQSKQSLIQRIIKFEIDNKLYQMKQFYFPKENTTQNLQEQFQIYLESNTENNNIQTLWEVQKEYSFRSSTPSFSCRFRLKNVATGLYLLKKNGLLSLTYDGFQEDCLLYLQPKKAVVNTEDIKYNQQVKIQTIDLNEILMMFCAEKSEKELIFKCIQLKKQKDPRDFQKLHEMDDIYFVQKSHLDKKKRQRILFDIKSADIQFYRIADRVSSLYPYLYNFFVFLQDWGVDHNNSYDLRYTLKVAFENQKDLFNQVSQLNQSLDNLDDFLQNDQNDIKFKQSILLQNGIINILIQILKLIHFQIYGNPIDQTIIYSELEKDIPDRSAQRIAFQKLRKTISRLYNILYQCIRKNNECSSYLISVENDYLEFFLKQLRFYREEVKILLKEAVIFMDTDDDKEEQNLIKWIQLLQPVTEENVEDQSFIVELLGLSVIDSLDLPLPQFQNIVRKKLFKSIRNSSIPVIQKSLARFFIDPNFKRPFVSFSCINSSSLPKQKKFGDNNFNLCELYRKAVEKKDLYQSIFRILPEQNSFDIGFIDQSIEQQISKRDTGILLKYENYLINIILLYTDLCKGRNKKMIAQIQNLGLTGHFIKICLSYFAPLKEDNQNPKKEQIHLRYYRCFVELYETFFLDVQPLIRISDYTNKCFLQADLQEFKIDEKSFNLFKDLNFSKEKKQEIENLSKEFIDLEYQGQSNQHKIMRNYAKSIVTKEEDEFDDQNLPSLSKQILDEFLLIQETFIDSIQYFYPKRFNLLELIRKNKKKENEIQALQQLSEQSLEAFLSNLKIIRNKIDFGHNNLITNTLILKKLPNIFIAYIDQFSQLLDPISQQEQEQDNLKNFKNKFEMDKNWIYYYFRKAIQLSGQDSPLITKVMIEALKILNTLQKLQLELKIVKRIQQEMLQLNNQTDEAEGPPEFQDENFFEDQLPSTNFNTIVYATLQKCGNNSILKQALIQNLEYNLNKAQNFIQGIKMVEIIEDEYELSLYWKVNGVSDKVQTKTPKEIQVLVKKSIIYLKEKQLMQDPDYYDQFQMNLLPQLSQKKWNNLQKQFEELKYSLEQILEIFKLPDYEKEDPVKSRKDYIVQLQNIVRNFKLHEYFLTIFQEVDIKLFKNNDFKEFYLCLVEFFEFFQLDNIDNKAILLPYISQFLDLAFMPYTEKSNQKTLEKRPIQVHKIIKQILVHTKNNQLEIKKIIDLIFFQITENSPIEEVQIVSRLKSQQSYSNIGVDILKSLAILQFIKILKNLTRDEFSCIQDNQKQILSHILKGKIMQLLVQPIELNKLKQLSGIFSNNIHEFLKLKMHIQTIQLMTDCCKNYLQGIQQIQRIILYDSLKSCIIELNSPFLLKRAYIRAIFEIYINKNIDKENENYNETIGLHEISEIMSKEIIPLLDLKNIYQYIEGLVKYQKEENLEVVWDTRKSLIKEKAIYFAKYQEFLTLSQADQDRLKKSDSDNQIRQKLYIGVVKDPQEFWKYLMKEGVLHFISDCFDERKQEIEKDLIDGRDTTLADDFSIVKTNLLKIKYLYEIMEREFQVRTDSFDLDEYKQLISKLEDLIPTRKIIKFGKNFRIQSVSQVEIFETVQDENFGANLDIEDKSKNEKSFKKNLRRFMMRNRINLDQLIGLLLNQRKKGDRMLEKGMFNVLNKDKCYAQVDEIEDFIRNECKINVPPPLPTGDKQSHEFLPSNVNLINDILKNYFFQKKVNLQPLPEDLKKAGNDEITNQHIRSMYESQLFKFFQSKYEDCRFKLSKSGEYEREIEALEMEEFSEQRVMRDYEMMQILINFFEEGEVAASYSINYNFLDLGEEEFEEFKVQYPNIVLEFISSAQDIFKDKDLYLLKMIRLILQAKQPQQSDLDGLKDADATIVGRSQRRILIFEIFQSSCIQTNLHIIALQCLHSQNLFELQYESLNVLILILYLGNKNSQYSIYYLLARDNRQLCTEFFNYLREFFYQDIDHEIRYIVQQKDLNKNFISQFELKTKMILQLLQQFCENVNREFQSFLRDQSLFQESTLTASTNVILECSNFLSYLLEDELLDMKIKDQMIISCINSLNEFCTGQEENQKIICNNKRLFTFINSKIITKMVKGEPQVRNFWGLSNIQKQIFKNYNLVKIQLVTLKKYIEDNQKLEDTNSGCCRRSKMTQKEIHQNLSKQHILTRQLERMEGDQIAELKESQENIQQDLDMFSASIKFLLVMITGNKDSTSVEYIVEQIDLLNLTVQLKNMYDQRIKKQIDNIQFENHCNQADDIFQICEPFYCSKGQVSTQVRTIVQIAFNIFIFFNYLCDMKFQNEVIDLYKPISYQDENQEIQNQQQSSLFTKYCSCCNSKQEDVKDTIQDITKQKISLIKVVPASKYVPYKNIQQDDSVIDNAISSRDMLIGQSQNSSFIKLIKQQLKQLQDQEKRLFNDPNQKKEVKQQSTQFWQISKQDEFLQWFQKFIGIQEIIHSQTKVLQKIYFKKPFISLFLTESIKNHLIYQAARDSDQERIQFLLDNSSNYFEQMRHKQYISQYRFFSPFINNWRELKYFSYNLVLAISIVQIISYDKMKDNPINSIQELNPLRTDNVYAFLVQLILSIIILISCSIEKYPVSIRAGFGNPKENENQQLKESAGFQPNLITRYYFKIIDSLSQNFSEDQVQKSFPKKFFMMATDPDALYNALYIGITIYAFIQPFAYSVLLFDIATSSEDLKNVLMAIWLNLKNIFKFSFLGFSIMFIYGVIGWNYFRDYYGDNGWSFLTTVTYTIKEGLRSGGGITEALNPPDSGSPHFWPRWAFDLSWFIIINMLFIQIIFGIILDTFGELRGKRTVLLQMVEQTCYICGQRRMDIDQKSSEEMGWYHHIYLEHNVYHMLFYIIYVSNMHENDCDSLEKYVKKDLSLGSIEFVPIQKSLAMGYQLEESQQDNIN